MDLEIKKNIKLADVTTFQLGGYCRGLIECSTVVEIKNAIKILTERKEPFVVIGWGSNILAADKDINCYVVRYLSDGPLITRKDNDLVVSASTKLDDLVLFCAENGLDGLLFASGIPGTVGGAVVGNAGAFGKQLGDVVKSVAILDPSIEEKVLFKGDIGFSYRNSKLKALGCPVLSVEIALKPGDKTEMLKQREHILSERKDKHPDVSQVPCAGSFFKNIEPSDKDQERKPAGWFLDQCGVKSLKCGGASVYDKHANIIIKVNSNCTSKDVLGLSKKMQNLVKEKFDIDLIREVVLLGEFD